MKAVTSDYSWAEGFVRTAVQVLRPNPSSLFVISHLNHSKMQNDGEIRVK